MSCLRKMRFTLEQQLYSRLRRMSKAKTKFNQYFAVYVPRLKRADDVIRVRSDMYVQVYSQPKGNRLHIANDRKCDMRS